MTISYHMTVTIKKQVSGYEKTGNLNVLRKKDILVFMYCKLENKKI